MNCGGLGCSTSFRGGLQAWVASPWPLPPCLQEEAGLPVQDRLYRSLKLWSFYVDLEERCVAEGRTG